MAYIDRDFREYVATLTFLADYIRWERTKDSEPVWVNAKNQTPYDGEQRRIKILQRKGLIVQRWPEKEAYMTTKEGRELKKFEGSDNWMAMTPIKQTFEGLTPKACHDKYWRMVRENLKISESTIKTLEERYEQFLLEVAERKRRGFDYKREIAEKMEGMGK